MHKLGRASTRRLQTCHNSLRKIVEKAILTTPVDFTVVCGYRGEEDQEHAYATGKSKARWGESKHNTRPSMAVDLAPYVSGKLVWDGDSEYYTQLSDHIYKVIKELQDNGEIEDTLTWGGTWGWDYPHWEIDTPI